VAVSASISSVFVQYLWCVRRKERFISATYQRFKSGGISNPASRHAWRATDVQEEWCPDIADCVHVCEARRLIVKAIGSMIALVLRGVQRPAVGDDAVDEERNFSSREESTRGIRSGQ